MRAKRLFLRLLYPPVLLLFVLLPLSILLLTLTFARELTAHPVAYATYALSAYTLTVICARAPSLFHALGRFKRENKYAKRFFDDRRWRLHASLYGAFALNVAFALLQLGLGITHRSFWYYSLFAYYLSLALMRFFLLRYSQKNTVGQDPIAERRGYFACGVLLLGLSLALALMLFFMVYWGRTFYHHQVTAIAMAAYTFTSLALTVTDLARHRKESAPISAAARGVGLAATLVSLLTLESTMLTAFGEADAETNRVLLMTTGTLILALTLALAVYMTAKGTKLLKEINNGKQKR